MSTTTRHPSYDPAAGRATIQEFDNAVDTSIRENRIVHLDYDEALDELLTAECEDAVCAVGGVVEYWGKDIDGNEWRVHLTR